jgi:NADH dehydrogenase
VTRYDEKDTLAVQLDGVSCLVHLPGILIESKRSNYQTANVDTTQVVVDACQRARVDHFVFVSSLGADINSRNQYFRSKGVAEEVVSQSGLSSTIIRTSILLGLGTAGARSLVGMASRASARLLGGGYHVLRPLDVDDLSYAILNCCSAQTEGVAIHELVGPEPVTHRELIIMTGRLMDRDVSISGMPVWTAKLGATMAGWIRRGGVTPTVIDVITADETVRTNADVDLGVSLTPLSETLKKLLPEDTHGSGVSP